MGIAGLLAALRQSQKRFQDAGRGPGPAAHPTGGLHERNMHKQHMITSAANCKGQHAEQCTQSVKAQGSNL